MNSSARSTHGTRLLPAVEGTPRVLTPPTRVCAGPAPGPGLLLQDRVGALQARQVLRPGWGVQAGRGGSQHTHEVSEAWALWRDECVAAVAVAQQQRAASDTCSVQDWRS
jgi:hypothetical protein